MIPQKPIILIQNNTNATLLVNLFASSPSALSGMNNSRITYAWNVTAFPFTALTTVQIQVKTSGLQSFATLTTQVASNSIDAVLAALNGLHVGTFFKTVSGANTFIATANNFFVYGNLTINQSNAQWITTGSCQVNPVTVNNASMTATDLRSGVPLSASSGSGVFPQNLGFGFTITYPLSTLQDGDTVQVNITATPGGPYTIQLILKENGITILNSTQSGTNVNFTFIYHLNAVYDFNGSVN